MYTETSSPRQLGDKALLESSPLDDSCHDRCFTFYYNMYGTNIGSLSVLLRSNGKDTLLWELKGNQGTGWQLGRAKILGTAPQNATVSLWNIALKKNFTQGVPIKHNSLKLKLFWKYWTLKLSLHVFGKLKYTVTYLNKNY